MISLAGAKFKNSSCQIVKNKEKNKMKKENLNIVMDINSMLEYQDDAIVSRVLVKEKTGNITLFAFDKGQELSEHSAPFNAVVQVTDGKAQISIDAKPYQVTTGQVIILPANIPHALFADERFKMILTMIKIV
jgi:quercetin dioxygenase-like cupin family protein